MIAQRSLKTDANTTSDMTMMTATAQNEEHLRLITDRNQLNEIRQFWIENVSHPDSDYDRYVEDLDSRPEFIRPHILVMEDSGGIRALVIGRIEKRRIHLKFGYASIYRPLLNMLVVFQGGFVGPIDFERTKTFVSELRSALHKGDADMAHLSAIDMSSDLYRIAKKQGSLTTRDFVSESDSHWRGTIPDSFDAFRSARSKNTRNNIKKWRKKISKEFGDRVRLDKLQDKNDLNRFMCEAESVAALTYQRRIGVGFRNDESNQKLLTQLMERDDLLFYLLYVDDTPIAFWNGRKFQGTFFGMTNGYDPRYKTYRPGHYILLQVIDELCRDPKIHRIDFGFGNAEYKRELCDARSEEAHVKIYAPSFRGFRLNLLRTMIVGSSNLAKKGFKKLGLYQKIKRRLRQS